MFEYKNIYPFEVIEIIQKGQIVGMTDRAAGEVRNVKDMTVEEIAFVFEHFDDSKGRYEFWVEIEIE